MKVTYDEQADAAYIEFSDRRPTGVIELSEGINLDTTESDEVVGIELLNVSKKIPLDSLFTLQTEKIEAAI